MTVEIEIVPSSSTLDMYGKQDSFSAYSLSGHIVLTLSSSSSIFGWTRKSKLLLQSLELTFEGCSEVCGPTIGYAATRLCYITQELAPNEALALTDDRQEQSNEPCRWNVVFNMTVPGWLPETTFFGTAGAFGVKYKLYATAKLWNSECRRDHSWSLSSLYSALCSPERLINAEKSILVRRFVSEPSFSNENIDIPNATFYINPQVNAPAEGSSTPHIPVDTWSKIQILATVPEYTNVEDDELPFTFRIRTKGLAPEEGKRLQFMGFSVNVLQREKCRERVTEDFKAWYPIPPPLQQPPLLPLRDSHQLSYLYDSLYVPLPQDDGADSRVFSVLSSASNGKYEIEDDTRVFSNDSEDSPSWYTLKCSIPIAHVFQDAPSSEWAGDGKLRPTISGPLLSIRHQISVEVTLDYDLPNSDSSTRAREAFMFSVPLRFERIPPRLPLPEISPLFAIESIPLTGLEPVLSLLLTPADYAPVLPAYSTLFDINGDRKIDPTPLPLYSPPEESSPSSGEQVLAYTSDCTTITDEKVCDLSYGRASYDLDGQTA
ncbi:hypothetical protein Moror_15184 [Moniliophthora roreri MCA 2997]|uniref:Arrestin-like N-terminal domain-containing protein n=2 Tax=Moniliophthora roreri TaxID=221103 RepID=V2X2R6_MONRO|nr:hypothetical protein Moror_15184 [Moniliophthora roreri MCA 2997]KAI3595147.1 hypothetical protein WG66_009381 [Moniliophthora roreri]